MTTRFTAADYRATEQDATLLREGMMTQAATQAEQIAQIPREIGTALQEFDGLRVIHTQAPEHPEGVIGSYLERSDVLHVLVHLRARIRVILDAADRETT